MHKAFQLVNRMNFIVFLAPSEAAPIARVLRFCYGEFGAETLLRHKKQRVSSIKAGIPRCTDCVHMGGLVIYPWAENSEPPDLFIIVSFVSVWVFKVLPQPPPLDAAASPQGVTSGRFAPW